MDIDYRNIYVKYLRLLIQLLYKLRDQESDEKKFLNARITPDMFPLKVQAKVAASFALRGCCRESGENFADPGTRIDSVAGLVGYLQDVVGLVEKSPSPEPNEVEDKAGFKMVRMAAPEYLGHFSLPNFFFHLSMVYAIAKSQGLSVTKGDFDGLHEYPEGFSWETDGDSKK